MIQPPRVPCLFAVLVLALLAGPRLHAAPSALPQSPSQAIDSTLMGVVWTPPAESDSALRELHRIHEIGATAIRLTRPPTEALLSRADSLELQLFVDLSVEYTPAPVLGDSLEAAANRFDRLLTQAREHPSVQFLGLAHTPDTTVPTTCNVLAQWTKRVRNEGPTSLQTYYVTPFSAAADQCAGAVDRVLLDVRARAHPVQYWRQWHDTSPSTGVGALGTWIRPRSETGLRVPHSPERQARYLETALDSLFGSMSPPPPSVFVYRWRDRTTSPLSSRRYGLHDRDGSRRPAARVVEGFYTDTQRVFAFPSGSSPSTTPLGLLLIGWGVIFLFATLFAQRPYIRDTASRYFSAHGFYRDSIRRGRNVSLGLNAMLLVLVAVAVGVMGVAAARITAVQPTTGRVLEALPRTLQALAASGLERPIVTGLLFGGAVFFLLGSWSLLLAFAAQAWSRFSVEQSLMLVVWPCWPAFAGMLVALVASTHSPVSPSLLGLLFVAGGVATLGAVTTRILRDYSSVTDVPPPILLLLALPSPLVVLGGLVGYVVMRYDLSVPFLWHLILYT